MLAELMSSHRTINVYIKTAKSFNLNHKINILIEQSTKLGLAFSNGIISKSCYNSI